MTTYISPIEQAYNLITWFFEQEICPGGLLGDVETFFDANYTKDIIRPPLLWFDKKEMTISDGVQSNHHLLIDLPFDLVCGVDVSNDIIEAERESINLASRCITALYKNIMKPHTLRDYVYVKGISIDSIEPNGVFQIMNKTNLIPAARVPITFTVELNMMQYLTTNGEPYSFDEIETHDSVTYDEITRD